MSLRFSTNIINYAFEAWGGKVSGKIDNLEYKEIIRKSCPGSCNNIIFINNFYFNIFFDIDNL